MRTFREIRILLTRDLLELYQLQMRGIAQKRIALQEREVGRLCYEAEEDLNAAGIVSLKKMLDIDAERWEAYKRKFLESLQNKAD